MLTVSWHDDEGGHEARVTNAFTRLGRSPEADLRIADASVSRRHAALSKAGEQWTLRDLGSQNGMMVDGHLVREHAVEDGDTASLGEVALRFVFSVHDSIGLDKGTSQEEAIAFLQHRPGSVAMSASDVAEGKVPQSAAQQSGANDEVTGALSQLAAVARALIAATSLRALFERTLDVVLENTPVEHAFLLLHDASGNQLVPKAGRSRDGRSGGFPISQSIASHVFRRNESVLTLDAPDDPRFDGESIIAQNIRSVMCAPLLNHDTTLGVLFAGSTSGRIALKEHHLHLLTVIANLAAVAIDQIRLRERIEEELLLRSRLTRYHSPTLVDQLLASSQGQGEMPPVEREVSVLFADIVGFSTRTERMAPAAVSRLLNGLFSELVEIIFSHEGTLDKFLGDGLMAIFGAPNDLPKHACRAVECALAMQRRIEELDVREGSTEPVRLRIGINSGTVIAGDIGSERRVEYTVLGNAVNVAARLEAFVAQPGETVIGPATQAALDPHLSTEPLGPQTLKGIQEAVLAFRVVP